MVSEHSGHFRYDTAPPPNDLDGLKYRASRLEGAPTVVLSEWRQATPWTNCLPRVIVDASARAGPRLSGLPRPSQQLQPNRRAIALAANPPAIAQPLHEVKAETRVTRLGTARRQAIGAAPFGDRNANAAVLDLRAHLDRVVTRTVVATVNGLDHELVHEQTEVDEGRLVHRLPKGLQLLASPPGALWLQRQGYCYRITHAGLPVFGYPVEAEVTRECPQEGPVSRSRSGSCAFDSLLTPVSAHARRLPRVRTGYEGMLPTRPGMQRPRGTRGALPARTREAKRFPRCRPGRGAMGALRHRPAISRVAKRAPVSAQGVRPSPRQRGA